MASRGTKAEKLLKQMGDQAVEHLHDLQGIASNPGSKELDVERWVQSVLKSCLGFSASGGYSIRAQETRGKMRPDLIVVRADKPVMVVEVKKLDFDLDKAQLRSGKTQLREYLHALDGVAWGILSNGFEWRLYDFSSAGNGLEICSFDIRSDGEQVIDTTKRGVEEACDKLIDLHESAMTSGAWRQIAREAAAFSPESLARAILSADVVRYITRVIKGEHDFRGSADALFDRIAALIENGLDDSVSDWSEAKQVELSKFVKSQKRAMTAAKKKRQRPAAEAPSVAEVAASAGVADDDSGTGAA